MKNTMDRKRVNVRALIALLLLCAMLPGLAPAALAVTDEDVDWRGIMTFEGNNVVTDIPLPLSDSESVETWNVKVSSSMMATAGMPCIVGNYIYITGDGHLYKINKETGKIEKRVDYHYPAWMYDYLVYGDGLIYVDSIDYISAHDPDTLEEVWRTSTGGEHTNGLCGTTGLFGPLVYQNGYLFSGKCCFKTTDFETDENGRNTPVWKIEDHFNWNSGAVVGDMYYVASTTTMYAVRYETGEIVDTLEFSEEEVTWSGVTYSADHSRLYWGEYAGTNIHTVEIGSDGKFVQDSHITKNFGIKMLSSPVVYGDRVYFSSTYLGVYDADTLETIYTNKNYGGSAYCEPVLTTAYADSDPSKPGLVYIYSQTYGSGSIVATCDWEGNTTAQETVVVASASIPQYTFYSFSADQDGSLYVYNDSGNLFRFNNTTINPIEAEYDLDISEGDIRIQSEGTYRITGTTETNNITILTSTTSVPVTLILDNVEIESDMAAPLIDIQRAGKVTIELVGDSSIVSTNRSVLYPALSSCSAVTIEGDGALTMTKSSRNPIETVEAPSLTVKSGTVTINANSNRGNPMTGGITVEGGRLCLYNESEKWGTSSSISVKGGVLEIDAPESMAAVYIDGGSFHVDGGAVLIKGGGSKAIYANTWGTGSQTPGFSSRVPDLLIRQSSVMVLTAENNAVYSGIGNNLKEKKSSQGVFRLTLNEVLEEDTTFTLYKHCGERKLELFRFTLPAGHKSVAFTAIPGVSYSISNEDYVLQNADGNAVFSIDDVSLKSASVTAAGNTGQTGGDELLLTNPFTDVESYDWYCAAVSLAYEEGIVSGVSETSFDPDSIMTRGMFVKILYNYEENPAVSKNDKRFADVDPYSWYFNASIWAEKNNLVIERTDGLFGGDDFATREEVATILYRYAVLKGMDVSARAELDGYTDAASVSDYAAQAMSWAVAEGIITGESATELNPLGTVSRAETTAALMRLLGKV